MGTLLPFTNRDAHYDNAKFRKRSWLKVLTQTILTSNTRRSCGSCSTGKVLIALILLGCAYLYLVESGTQGPEDFRRHGVSTHIEGGGGSISTKGGKASRFSTFGSLRRKPPILAPQVDQTGKKSLSGVQSDNATKDQQDALVEGSKSLQQDAVSMDRQAEIVEAFKHAWKGYKTYAMGYDELQPLSKKGVNGLGGLGATVVDALDTAMIMNLGDVVKEAGSWIEHELPARLKEQGQVNLFETTIRVLGGLLSAYQLSGGGASTGGPITWGAKGDAHLQGPKPEVYLERATDLADRLMSAFTSSPSAIPYSDVILREKTAHAASGDSASTAEVATLQLEFGYLSQVSGDPKYSKAAMHVYEHLKNLPKLEGLVPIYLSPHSGQFQGNNIRLGSRGDSYYEYLLKVWLQQGGADQSTATIAYLREMYDEAMTGVRHRLVRKSSPNSLVFVGELPNGEFGSFSPKMDHLVCFLAGNLALGATKGLTKQEAHEKKLLTERDLQDLQLAEDLGKTCYEMYAVTATGIAPEIVYFNMDGELNNSVSNEKDYKQDISIKPNDHHNLLRPETVESLFILYRITEDVKYREWGWKIFKAFDAHSKVPSGGYSSLDDVTVVPAPKRDKQETFFLGETLKYLYLLFAPTDVLPLNQFVFNTEAHPVPIRPQGGESAG